MCSHSPYAQHKNVASNDWWLFPPYAMKAISEGLNSLQINTPGRVLESVLHRVKGEDLPVKSYHILFCPIYVLDDWLQNLDVAGQQKWEPRSRIGVYLGHIRYYAGSVALVWNLTTGRVSPQLHGVFDNIFSTVPSMVSGTIPPTRGKLLKYSSEMATPTDVNFADTWLHFQSNKDEWDQITDPFAVVFDHRDSHRGNNHWQNPMSHTNSIPLSKGDGSPGISSPLPKHNQLNYSAFESFATSRKKYKEGRVGTKVHIFGPAPSMGDKTRDLSESVLLMPKMTKPHGNGLRLFPRLREQKENEELWKHKSHVSFSMATAKKFAIGMLSLFALVTNA